MPYVNYGGLIVVKERVFLMSEFGYQSDFPELVCVDANTGKLLWKREINHLSIAVPDEQARKKAAAAWRQYACFDMEGNLKWLQWFPQGGGSASKSASRSDTGDGCGGCRSPLAWGDLFVADTFGWVRAFDRKTGKLAWALSRDDQKIGQHEVMSPVVMTIGPSAGSGQGADVLLCNGPLAIRLPDGKPLPIEAWGNPGMMAVLNTDQRDTVFLTGGGEHGGWIDKGRAVAATGSI